MRYLFQVLLWVSVSNLYGQHHGDVWMFGSNSGFDFSACVPMPIQSSNIGFEECSTISNDNGELLFYTNSDNVWNKNNSLMPNGSMIYNSSGSLSQVLIIPKPESSNLYYIFTTAVQGGNTFQYHTVDMTLDGGLGDLVSTNTIIYNAPITEQVAATYHSNGVDIWVLTHEYGTNNFLSFLVTNSGVNPVPIVSSIGPAHQQCFSSTNARGQIKFSPDGKKIAFNANGVGGNTLTNILSIFDFDHNSGLISNPINLPFSGGEFGLSFSSDNSKLYGGTWKAIGFPANTYNQLYQFDLSSNNAQTIIGSKQIIDSTWAPYGSIKLAPDGKIYVRIGTEIGVINSPNLNGSACNYNSQAFVIGGNNGGQYGLNNYIEYTQYCSTNSIEEVDLNREIQLFPNPASETLTISLPENASTTECILVDNLGKEMKRFSVSGVENILDVSDLNKGIYLLKIGEEIRKISIE